jgi:hypothetical protein
MTLHPVRTVTFTTALCLLAAPAFAQQDHGVRGGVQNTAEMLQYRRIQIPLKQKMVNALGPGTLAGSILCALGTATGPPALALDRRLELANNTRMAIVEIYIARAGTECWQIDLLGDEILPAANCAIVEIDDGAGCRFDLKAIFDDGTTVIRRDVNICVVERYAISPVNESRRGAPIHRFQLHFGQGWPEHQLECRPCCPTQPA